MVALTHSHKPPHSHTHDCIPLHIRLYIPQSIEERQGVPERWNVLGEETEQWGKVKDRENERIPRLVVRSLLVFPLDHLKVLNSRGLFSDDPEGLHLKSLSASVHGHSAEICDLPALANVCRIKMISCFKEATLPKSMEETLKELEELLMLHVMIFSPCRQ